ncbi:heat-inducible transcriptional repressor HrcA [Intrasporangium calvum]|uniref:Heat-inducible transcription repressor HrcA n=1 Tax=Intrasporangium calvum (strain ATCC 23552 / DSM 43043 / JCM 3097 / NBRC 12989 / NCIMB 10167 / NRRL B-3866 / 7 KIP) TaxID=710696 RepID=E6SDK2_INTC7|nr:heat-inducible transcriptional repressor HrcA [Intrasporangium calvum]ADU48654.1 heat-inducible transcription repressor HrcA [Intrasporangium calvum DSM 43043]AXG13654.1 heat-inducible transcriptional repressor HrcA [Intrasporangium calvum]
MSEDRKLMVLRAIVQDYVQTSEPVGSKALVDRHHLGVSAATVRNDMAQLEEEGLIHAPHTSAGRVPTDAGYRVFVDRLSQLKPLSAGERRAISQFLQGAVDLDDVVDRTVRLLAGLTRQVAVMQYPSLTRSTVRHIELVPVGAAHLMVILIVNTGRVEQRVVETRSLPAGTDGEELVARVRASLNEVSAGVPFTAAATELRRLVEQAPGEERPVVEAIVSALSDALVEEREERVVLAGQANLARSGGDFATSVAPILEALEEHVVLLRLLGQLGEDPDAISVRIGSENPVSGLQTTSLVSVGYGSGLERVASLGVLGPTRMDYPTTMASVRAVARYVSQILDENNNG